MYLSWSDEFDGTSINLENWGYNIGGGGWGNNELQVYTSSSVNSNVQDGKLNITATQIQNTYYSARLITQGKREFRYGRIDIRAKLPIGRGIWPALWMLGANFNTVGWPRCGEIDIMEYLGHEPWKVHGSIHYFDTGHKSRTRSYALTTNDNFNDKFHIFSIVWQENSIRWYVDYQLYHEIKDTDIKFEAFRLPQFFIFNVAVGGNWPGNPDATTVFPQTMSVDYIRVFQVPED
jgi:beta-glucanase (GH16 family)